LYVSVSPPAPISSYKQASGQIFKDDVNGFSSFLDVYFMKGKGSGGKRVNKNKLVGKKSGSPWGT
jgi:hypothetical protein